MGEKKRRVNLHGTVKEKSNYKDYKLKPESWWFRLGAWSAVIGVIFVIMLIDPKRRLNAFIDVIGMPGLVAICALLSCALFLQIRKRWR